MNISKSNEYFQVSRACSVSFSPQVTPGPRMLGEDPEWHLLFPARLPPSSGYGCGLTRYLIAISWPLL